MKILLIFVCLVVLYIIFKKRKPESESKSIKEPVELSLEQRVEKINDRDFEEIFKNDRDFEEISEYYAITIEEVEYIKKYGEEIIRDKEIAKEILILEGKLKYLKYIKQRDKIKAERLRIYNKYKHKHLYIDEQKFE